MTSSFTTTTSLGDASNGISNSPHSSMLVQQDFLTTQAWDSLRNTSAWDNGTTAMPSGPRPEDYLEFQIGLGINLYYPPVLAMVGTLGNVLSFLVAIQGSNRHSSPAVFMAALAVLDTLMLQVGLFQYWCLFNFFPHLITKTHCHIMFFVVNMNGNYSHWTIVALTLERLFAVVYPLKLKKFNSVTRTYQILAIIGLIAIVKNIHYIWNVDFVYNEKAGTAMCAFGIETQGWWVIAWQWFDTCISSVIPFAIIITANIIIIRCLRDKSGILTRGGKVSRGTTSDSSSGTQNSSVLTSEQESSGSRRGISVIRKKSLDDQRSVRINTAHNGHLKEAADSSQIEMQIMNKKVSTPSEAGCYTQKGDVVNPVYEADDSTSDVAQTGAQQPALIGKKRAGSSREKLDPNRLTGMLLAVSIAFVLLTAPLFLFRTYFSFSDPNETPQSAAAYYLGHHICHKLWYTNNGINFWLYCIVGRRFRHCLKAMLRRYICCKALRVPLWSFATCNCVKKLQKIKG